MRPTVETVTQPSRWTSRTPRSSLTLLHDRRPGVGEVVDFMPVTGVVVSNRHRIVRMVRCVRGELRFAIDIAPRFDDGREAHTHAPERERRRLRG